MKDNPFLAQQAFDNEVARNDYLNEFRAQLDEESQELFNQHSELAQQEQERASIRLKKEKKRKASNVDNGNKSEKKKKKRLFGWFRKSKNKEKDKETKQKKKELEEKSNNLLASYESDSAGENDQIGPLPMIANKSGGSSPLTYRQRSKPGLGVNKQKSSSSGSSSNIPDYLESDKLPNIKLDYYSLYFILLCLLLRHYNNGRNFLIFNISTTAIRMPEMGDRILDIFGIMTKCGNIYRTLCYLKICMKVLATEAGYFDDVLQRLADIKEYLDDEKDASLLTLREKLHLKKIITRMSNWCKLCITRYQHVFFGATGPRALKSCLRLWKFCFSMLYKLNNMDEYEDSFERKWCEKVKDIIKKSIYDYEFPRLVHLYKEKQVDGDIGPSFFYSKQTYNQQYQKYNKMKAKKERQLQKKQMQDSFKIPIIKNHGVSNKMRQFSQKLVTSHKSMYSTTSSISSHYTGSGAPKNGAKHLNVDSVYTALSDQTAVSGTSTVFADSPVDDATQLIMVIKGCRKYLVLDEEEYESAFKSYCTLTHFSLLKISSSQYMTLAFSFTNLYLRVLAFGIQEKIEERRANLEFASKNYRNKKNKTKGSSDEAEQMNQFLENTDFEVDPSVWALYQELKRFYDDLKRIYKALKKKKIHASLPEVRYSDHYNDIIEYWCQYQGIKFVNPYNGYVYKLTSSESWKKISENALYSTSVIDLFTLIDPLQHWFLNLPYTNKNLLDFAGLLTSIVNAYVNTLHEKISKYLLKELEKKELAFYSKKKDHKMVVWNFPMKLMIAVNNLLMAKTQLQQTISKLMLDRRYTSIANNDDKKKKRRYHRIGKSGHTSLARYHTLKQTMLLPPDLMSMNGSSVRSDSIGTATTFYKHKILPSEFNFNYFDEEDDIEVWNSLNCVEAFQTINKHLSSISFLIAQGLNSDISHEIFLLLWENDKYPPNMKLSKEEVEDELMDMLWKKLCTKCDLLNENISPLFTPYILTDFFSLICLDFMKLLIPKRLKYVLNLNQLTRIEYAIAEIQNFLLDCYNIEPILIEQNENLYKLKHLINVQLGGTKILINHHSELEKDEDWAEEYELQTEPYLGPKALWLIIKHRAKHHKHDEKLVKYYEQRSGIKAQVKNFTKAIRNRWG